MLELALACAAFLGIHFLVSGTALRGVIVARIGEGPYRGLFSLASLAALIWIAAAYRDAPLVALWAFGAWARWVALALTAVGFVLVVAGLTTRNPTAAGQERSFNTGAAPVGIIKVTRHPFLWGVAFWALGHLLVAGHAAALLLFGSLLVLALLGSLSIDRRKRSQDPQAFARLEAETSWLPLAALQQRKTTLHWHEIGWWRLLLAAILWLAFLLVLHQWLFSRSPLPVW